MYLANCTCTVNQQFLWSLLLIQCFMVLPQMLQRVVKLLCQLHCEALYCRQTYILIFFTFVSRDSTELDRSSSKEFSALNPSHPTHSSVQSVDISHKKKLFRQQCMMFDKLLQCFTIFIFCLTDGC